MEIKDSWINWWEFAPQKDQFLVKVFKSETKKETESGIILGTRESKVEDRPNAGIILAIGPDVKNFKVGEFIYWQMTAGYDLEMIRKEEENDKYLLLYPDAVLGKRVKDVRN